MAEKSKILIVDDDENIADLISLYLTKECFDTLQAHDGNEALKKFKEYNPDLVLLDIMLPGIDGYQVCREIRNASDTPVIMLSAKGETFDKVLGLEMGADDYIMKPFDSKEMVARVKAVLRRFDRSGNPKPADDENVITFNGLKINITNYTVTFNGAQVDMTPKEIELFHYLASHPNHVFTREQLLSELWGYDYLGDTRTVDVHIKRLREKFSGAVGWEIATVWGVGYKFEVR